MLLYINAQAHAHIYTSVHEYVCGCATIGEISSVLEKFQASGKKIPVTNTDRKEVLLLCSVLGLTC